MDLHLVHFLFVFVVICTACAFCGSTSISFDFLLMTISFDLIPFFKPQAFLVRFNSILQSSILFVFPTISSSFHYLLPMVLSLPVQVPPPFHLPFLGPGFQAFPSNFLQAPYYPFPFPWRSSLLCCCLTVLRVCVCALSCVALWFISQLSWTQLFLFNKLHWSVKKKKKRGHTRV